MSIAKSPEQINRPDDADLVLEFGRHAGKTLERIGRTDIGYLRWLVGAFDNGNEADAEISDAAEAVLSWLKARARKGAA